MDEEKKQNDSQDEGLEKDKQPSMDQGDVVPGSSPDVTEDKSAEDKEGEGDVSSELSPEELEAISKGLEVLGEEGGESIPEIPDLESSGSDAAQLSIDELIASVKSSSPFDLTSEGQDAAASSQPQAQPVSFPEIDASGSKHAAGGKLDKKMDLLMDIPVKITVVLGRTRKTIGEILAVEPGVVIELDKQVGEPMEITINDRPVFKGEVVVIEENFGVRITEIVEKHDKLGK